MLNANNESDLYLFTNSAMIEFIECCAISSSISQMANDFQSKTTMLFAETGCLRNAMERSVNLMNYNRSLVRKLHYRHQKRITTLARCICLTFCFIFIS